MTVAEAVAPLVRAAVGREAPVEIRGWDGSRIGPPNAQWAMKINNRRGLRRLLWAPNELGMACRRFCTIPAGIWGALACCVGAHPDVDRGAAAEPRRAPQTSFDGFR